MDAGECSMMRDLEPGIGRAIRFKDPEGNVVELIHGGDAVNDAYGGRDVKPLALNHVVLHTRDRPRMEQFYGCRTHWPTS
jgi:catechol-2,3-dioxygenase